MMAYDYSQYGGVLVKRDEKVLTITLNAPETLNAFTGPMHTSMSRIWDDVNDDRDVHVVVLTGAGRAFSAGGNVIAMQKKIDDPDAWDAGMPEARRIVFRMLECDKPIIARVNGHARLSKADRIRLRGGRGGAEGSLFGPGQASNFH
jgi:enoyl-CoA hydratase